VRLAREPNRPLSALGDELGVSVTTLRNWLKAAPKDKSTAGRVVSLEEQVRQLKHENDQLREERAIPKKRRPSSPRIRDAVRVHPSPRPHLARHDDVSSAGGVEGRLLRVARTPAL
jgi:transposase-like protein